MTSTTPFDPYDARPAVLVIDDELGPRESLRFLLKEEYRVLCADSVDRGLDLVREHMPDVVIMDIRMPVMDGLAAARQIRSLGREDAKTIPIIAMTANAYEEDVQKSREAGMNAHLSKPIEPEILYETLRRFVAHG